MTATNTQIENAVKEALEKQMGGKATVFVLDDGLEFHVDCGDRVPTFAGFAGGITSGWVSRKSGFALMTTGVDPLGLGAWLDLLAPLGWV